MRKFTIVCTLICTTFVAFSQSGEEEKVKQAIQTRWDANRNRDLAAWKASWHHDANASNTFISKDGYNVTKSWDSLNAMMERDIKDNPNPDNSGKITLENFVIKTDGNLAVAEYNTVFTPNKDQSSMFPYLGAVHYNSYDVLVKEDGQWKTHSRILSFPGSYANTHMAEVDLNTAGYDLLTTKKVKEAIEVFKLNVKLFPDSWNVYDSLGEAYAAAGDIKNAIENYEKSIQLNPNSDSGKAALVKLKHK